MTRRTDRRINTRDVISALQVQRIEQLSAQLGYSTQASNLCRAITGVALPALSRDEAETYIAKLEAELAERAR